MMNTNRAKLNRQFWACWLSVIVLTMLLAALRPFFKSPGPIFGLILMCAIVIVFLLMYRTRCVHCAAHLKWLGVRWIPATGVEYSTNCPNCSVRLDRRAPYHLAEHQRARGESTLQ